MNDYRLLINGELVAGDLEMPVLNPATEEVIAQCPRASESQCLQAIEAAKAAFPAWSACDPKERAAMLVAIADRIDENRAALAALLTAEAGKPIGNATNEVAATAEFYRHFAATHLDRKVIEDSADRHVEVKYRPLGVVAAIVPWNFPLSLSAIKVPAALLTGNTVILKPAPTTPLSTLLLASLTVDILPPGVLNVITDANDLGAILSTHPDVRKVSFTGSTVTGKKVMSSAADTLKRLTLELGGNDPAIVLDDADPAEIAPKIFDAAFANNGQLCMAIKRVYAHASIYDALCGELTKIANAAIVGDGMDARTTLGPLQNEQQYRKVLELLDDVKQTGTILTGGAALDRKGYFIEPTIVRDIADGSRLVDEEQFGPVLPLIRFEDEDDAVRKANASEYGLGASVWSADADRAAEVAEQLDAGTVWVNKHLELVTHVSYGGAKQSGFGLAFGEEGLEEFCQYQVINR